MKLLWKTICKNLILFGVFALLFPTLVFAVPEICANGLDDDSTGGDALCTGIDQDNDGYPSVADGGTDCDDTDYKVLPGEYYSTTCSGNPGYRKCNTDGSWATCVQTSVTPLCEATGGGACYYVDPASGNDTTGDGSYATPWATLQCVGKWTTGAPGCNIDPAPGSVIYLVGTGSYTDTYIENTGEQPSSYYGDSTRSGSAGFPITFKRYPGSTVVMTCAGSYSSGSDGSQTGTKGSCFRLNTMDYVNLVDLSMTGGWGSAIAAPGSSYVRVLRGSYSDKKGWSNDNLSILNASQGNYNEFSWNYVYDLTDDHRTDGFYPNVSAAAFFNDSTGGGHKANYNRIGWSSASVNGRGLKWKHGAATVPTNSEAKGNIIWNSYGGIEANTTSVYMSQNLIYESSNEYCFRWDVGAGGDDVISDVRLNRNTCVAARLVAFGTASSFDATLGPTDISHNVNLDDSAYSGDVFGVSIMQYGNDTALAELLATFSIDENAYWNSNTSGYKWGWFNDNAGSGPGPSGPAGFGTTTYATWRDYPPTVDAGYAKFDLNSTASSFTLSTDGSFTYSGGVDAGWRTGNVHTYTFEDLSDCTTGVESACQSDNGITLSGTNPAGLRINNAAHFGGGVFAPVGSGLVCGSGDASGTGAGYVDESIPSGRADSMCLNMFVGFFNGFLQNVSTTGNHGPSLKYSTPSSANCTGYISIDFTLDDPRIIVEVNNSTCGGNNPTTGNANLAMNIGNWTPKNNQYYWMSLCGSVNTSATTTSIQDGNGTVSLYIDGSKVTEYTNVNMRGDSTTSNFDSVHGPRSYRGFGVENYKGLMCFDQMIIETGTTTPQTAPAATVGSGDGPYWYAVAGDGMEQSKLSEDCSSPGTGSNYVSSDWSYDWKSGKSFVTSPDNNDYPCSASCPSCTTSNSLAATTSAANGGAGVYYSAGENMASVLSSTADGVYIHGHVYLDNLPSVSMALAGIAQCTSFNCSTGGSTVNQFLALTVTNGKWGLLPKTSGTVGTAHESTATAVADTWTEFEIAVNDSNECSLAIDGVWVLDEVTCNQSISAWAIPASNTGFRFPVIGIIDSITESGAFTANYDDVDIGGASFWSDKGRAAASVPDDFATPTPTPTPGPSATGFIAPQAKRGMRF